MGLVVGYVTAMWRYVVLLWNSDLSCDFFVAVV